MYQLKIKMMKCHHVHIELHVSVLSQNLEICVVNFVAVVLYCSTEYWSLLTCSIIDSTTRGVVRCIVNETKPNY